MKEQHITVEKTARYYTLGGDTGTPAELWFVCHGYGQLAGYFISHFQKISGDARMVVAPEALSRFYLQNMSDRVGATWMTREDRLFEIGDYLAYLNRLSDHILATVTGTAPKVTLLGFSQGTATVCRWLTNGHVPASRIILWAGTIPPELDLSALSAHLKNVEWLIVCGDSDPYASPEIIRKEKARLTDAGIHFKEIDFSGGHVMNEKVLADIAGKR